MLLLASGLFLLLAQAWILLVQLVGTRGRDWGALVFIAYLFSHLPFFSWARDIFAVFLLPSFVLCGCLIVRGAQEFWAMGLTLVFWDPFLSFFSYDLINTHDIGHTSVYGLKIALHSLQLLNRALLYMWYFNGFKQTNKHTHTLNQQISALDIARHELSAFRRSRESVSRGWDHLDTFQFWVRPPWIQAPRVQARFLECDSAHHTLTQAQSSQDGIWIFTDGSVQDEFSGAAAIFDDAHGPFGTTSLQFPLGPMQLSTDAKLASIRGALSHLAGSRAWSHATIIMESQAAIQMLMGTDWRRACTSVLSIQQLIQTLMARGQQV